MAESYVFWSEAEKEWLRKNYKTCSKEEAEKELCRNWHNICRMARELGIKRKSTLSNNNTRNFVENSMTTKQIAKIMGVAEEEVVMWSIVYPECLPTKEVAGVKRMIWESVVKFLKTHQELWDSTKMPHKDWLDEYKWFQKKHDEDFIRMVQKRWGRDAK